MQIWKLWLLLTTYATIKAVHDLFFIIVIHCKHFLGFLFAGTGLAGMRQRDLIQWYVGQQNEKNSYSSMEEAATEVSKIKAIIEVNQL